MAEIYRFRTAGSCLGLCLSFFLVGASGCGSDDDDESLNISCTVGGNSPGLGYCVDFEEVTKSLAAQACQDAYQGTLNEDGLCSVATGTLGCINHDEESGVKTTIWLNGADWPDAPDQRETLCNGKETTQKA